MLYFSRLLQNFIVAVKLSYFMFARTRGYKIASPISKIMTSERAGNSDVLSTSAFLYIAFVAKSLLYSYDTNANHDTTTSQWEEIIARKSHLSLPAS